MTFQFRMDQVLDYKHNQKEMVQKEFAEHQEKFEEIGMALYELLKKKETIQLQQSERIVGGEQVRTIQHYGFYIDTMEKEAHSLQHRLHIARDNMEDAKGRLLEKTIDVKKYEKLKEKQHERYREDLKQQEARYMDELVVIRHTNHEIR
ncbi:flagellar export protein FliJ [Alkalihalobacillus sp. AL-G]|uniref:flagellar export protein FliJ n=1 Tax=Alkalihalobacillus sp. AL-G TaxID=2926399 RepID=UPI00272B4428|nr:flagellar export protein FliJ [Alkalihalobacillus sp. AL-G]WLD95154.1 flagellar export protein FliJ [Alkalihalobacillus sp. AL-G]